MKKILAILLTLVLAAGCVTLLASCGGKEEPETTVPADVSEEVPSEEATEAESKDASEAESEEASEAVSEDATEAESEEASDAATTEAEKEEVKAPASKAEILKVYNDAVNAAITNKAGYHKNRVCTINSLEGGAILKINVAKQAVYDFLGVGTKEWDNAKGKAQYLGKASLAESDITNATCELKDGKYIIAIDLKNGSSSASGSGKSDSSPMSKTGLFTGEGDKGEYDYKNAGNIHYALNHTDGAALESASMNVSKGKIKATIDAETGNIENLEISFNFGVTLSNVKYTIAKISQGTGNADTVVKFTNFKY